MSLLFTENEKRNLGALKNSPVHGTVTTESTGNKQKREVSYSIGDEIIPELIDQSPPYDYEELVQAMDEAYPTYFKNPDEKRYLGKQMPLVVAHTKGSHIIFLHFKISPNIFSIFFPPHVTFLHSFIVAPCTTINNIAHCTASLVRSGWYGGGYRPMSSPYHKRYIGSLARLGMLRSSDANDYWRRPQKRHIGALARSGHFRSTSAFGPVHSSFVRSGRARSQIVGS